MSSKTPSIWLDAWLIADSTACICIDCIPLIERVLNRLPCVATRTEYKRIGIRSLRMVLGTGDEMLNICRLDEMYALACVSFVQTLTQASQAVRKGPISGASRTIFQANEIAEDESWFRMSCARLRFSDAASIPPPLLDRMSWSESWRGNPMQRITMTSHRAQRHV